MYQTHQIVATVLTACGIETFKKILTSNDANSKLQQCLPLAVLKQIEFWQDWEGIDFLVATVLTACGIETGWFVFSDLL